MGIGTELLMGELTDTNSSWIASRLPALGIELQWVSIIGDDLPRLTEASDLQRRSSDARCRHDGDRSCRFRRPWPNG
jgi:nicotinamide-nucleotide amidase